MFTSSSCSSLVLLRVVIEMRRSESLICSTAMTDGRAGLSSGCAGFPRNRHGVPGREAYPSMSSLGCWASCSFHGLGSCQAAQSHFPSTAETSLGKCSEWNLLSCLSSQRGASLKISDLSGISFFLNLIFWTWKQCHGAILVTLHLSSCFPPYLLLRRKRKGNWSRVQDISLNCMH